MANPRLIILTSDDRPREFMLAGAVSIGRAADNTICLTDETIARYHAIIEARGENFWLSALDGAYGTTVNGEPVRTAHHLKDRDVISIGGAVNLRYLAGLEVPTPNAPLATVETTTAEPTPPPPAPMPFTPDGPGASRDNQTGSPLHIATAVLVGLLIVAIIGIMMRKPFWVDEGHCGSIRIVSPASGEIINKAMLVKVRADKPQCLRGIRYRIDEREFASSTAGVFEALLDPAELKKQFADLKEGVHQLSIVASTGSEQLTAEVSLTLEFPDTQSEISLEQVRSLVEKLATEIVGHGGTLEFERAFLERIRDATNGFRQDIIPAAETQEAALGIRKAFYDEGLKPVHGFVLAHSRSHFKGEQVPPGCGADPNGVGLLRVPRTWLAQFGRSSADPIEAVKVAAKQLKGLRDNFGEEEDIIYAIACFGESSTRVGEITQKIPDAHERRNFWQVFERGALKPEEVNRVVCFFAAGIVALNPDKFGLRTKSLVEVYR